MRSRIVGFIAEVVLLVGAAAINLLTQDWHNPVPHLIAIAAAVGTALIAMIRLEPHASKPVAPQQRRSPAILPVVQSIIIVALLCGGPGVSAVTFLPNLNTVGTVHLPSTQTVSPPLSLKHRD